MRTISISITRPQSGKTTKASLSRIGNSRLLIGTRERKNEMADKKMTLEEAIHNEQGWQEALREAEQKASASPTLYNRDRVVEAKNALEFYNGYVKYDYIRDFDGNIKLFRYETDGRIVECKEGEKGYPRFDENVVIERVPGMIQKLAGEAQRLKKASDLGKRFSNRTFGNFDKSKCEQAHKAAWGYSQRDNLFDSERNSLLFLGGVGTGKTHLAAAIANELIDRSIPVLFGTFIDHLQKIKDEFNHTSLDTYLSRMKVTPMLVIDDLGKEKRTDWSQQVLFDVINYRYEHMLPTIITTNFDDTELMNYVGNATASRLNEMSTAIHMNGADYRKGQR